MAPGAPPAGSRLLVKTEGAGRLGRATEPKGPSRASDRPWSPGRASRPGISPTDPETTSDVAAEGPMMAKADAACGGHPGARSADRQLGLGPRAGGWPLIVCPTGPPRHLRGTVRQPRAARPGAMSCPATVSALSEG